MNSTKDESSAQKLKRKVLRYMVEHPEAKDTAAGIMEWWIDAGNSEATLCAVLDGLIELRWVTIMRYGKIVVYGFDKTHIEEVRAYLES